LAPYAATKAAIANPFPSLAQLLGEKGIRVNSPPSSRQVYVLLASDEGS
jgi:hypothetical protein